MKKILFFSLAVLAVSAVNVSFAMAQAGPPAVNSASMLPTGNVSGPTVDLIWNQVQEIDQYFVRLDDNGVNNLNLTHYDDPRFETCLTAAPYHYMCEDRILATDVCSAGVCKIEGVQVEAGKTYDYWINGCGNGYGNGCTLNATLSDSAATTFTAAAATGTAGAPVSCQLSVSGSPARYQTDHLFWSATSTPTTDYKIKWYGTRNGIIDANGDEYPAPINKVNFTWTDGPWASSSFVGDYTRYFKAFDSSNVEVCTSNVVSASIVDAPQPASVSLSISTSSIRYCDGQWTWHVTSTPDTGYKIKWFGTKNGAQDEFGGDYGQNTDLTWTDGPWATSSVVGDYTRYVGLFDSAGNQVATSTSVNVSILGCGAPPTPQVSCSVSVSGSPARYNTDHLIWTVTSTPSIGYQVRWFGTKNGVQDEFGGYYGQHTNLYWDDGPWATSSFVGNYTRYVGLFDANNIQVCTSTSVNASIVDLNSADIAISKSVDNAAPQAGGAISYTLIVSAFGPATSTGVIATDILPAGLTFVSASSSIGSYSSSSGIWSIGDMSASSSATLIINALVNFGTAGQTITNSVSVAQSASSADWNTQNNAVNVPISVAQNPGPGPEPQPPCVGCGGGSVFVEFHNLYINNGAAITSSTNVVLSIIGTPVYQMKISNTPDFSNSDWELYVTTKPWVLTSGDGQKTVYMKFRFVSGVELETVHASINLVQPIVEAVAKGEVLGEATSTIGGCGKYLNSYIKLGAKNNVEDVKKLQMFLNQNLGINLPITGYYGDATYNAVLQLQLKYNIAILNPWVSHGLASNTTPTGYVYKTTQWFINSLMCSQFVSQFPELP